MKKANSTFLAQNNKNASFCVKTKKMIQKEPSCASQMFLDFIML